jgi:glycosyltransferase involved in cell wall biosynthesis
MPTAGRRSFVPRAIRYYQAQTYADRELVIFDDGAIDGPIRDLVPKDDRTIRYYARQPRSPDRSVGELRNICCDLASGELIAHWDDDDWSGPDRLDHQIGLIKGGTADIVGYSSMYFYDERDAPGKGQLWLYQADHEGYAIGTSFLYHRLFWYHRQFRPLNVGEDNRFQQNMETSEGGPRVLTVAGHVPLRMVARVHNQSTAPKPLAGDQWRQITEPGLAERIRELLL